MTEDFVLCTQLAKDTHPVADWALCSVRLFNDARFSWLVLVPRRPALCEWHDLAAPDRSLLAAEIGRASAGLKRVSAATKMNVGALGNIVAQFHVHVVGRHPGDAAWPRPVWGSGTPVPYELTAMQELLERLRAGL
ncbi:MAG TPA: HIT family protein [Rhizomicrobium sp.]|jgi:diadenosine tetraphosphate (Ap4A) HIT family hydrolase